MNYALAPDELAALRPYLEGDGPQENGEWYMHCPLHPDAQRSASLNVHKGSYFCHAGCGGGDVSILMSKRGDWHHPSSAQNGHSNGRIDAGAAVPSSGLPPTSVVSSWHKALVGGALASLTEVRGITKETVDRFQLGWDSAQRAYTIPIYNSLGELVNVRFYTPRPAMDRRKIWSIKGHGAAKLFPIDQMDSAEIIICEGELDAMITIQHGMAAITRTGGATQWSPAWREFFRDKVVYLCHDCDTAGEEGNRKVGKALEGVAELYVLRLPYAVTEKHGKDLTDFFMDGHTAADLRELMNDALPFGDVRTEPVDIPDSSVLEAFDSSRSGQPLRLSVTTRGKKEPGYTIPAEYRLDCDRGAGAKCEFCPLAAVSGSVDVRVEPSSPSVLKLVGAQERAVLGVLREEYGIPKCPRLDIDVLSHQAVEILFARSSVDRLSAGNAEPGDFKPIRLVSVGRHNTASNTTVQVTGSLHPSPLTQENEFLAWEVHPMETSLDTFEITAEIHKALAVFEPAPEQRPLDKAYEIAAEHAANVTRIYGLLPMHVAMDLVFHSVLAFDFEGQPMDRGWLDLIVVGDTRTGKSEAATRLTEHYGAGEVISCESASFAGVIGGLQQYSGKEWAVSWGAIPTNDRRLVVLDEVSGLAPEQIAQLSSVRSSGIAQLTKIQSEQTYARTRLIWLGNPRNGTMSDYTYGVDALVPLIGNNEDVARFDMATSVRTGQVPAEEINKRHRAVPEAHSVAASRLLLRWVWSRSAGDVQWASGAEGACYAASLEMSRRYVEQPPLVQGANIRKKLARVAVALAARTHSTDDTGELVLVRQIHVKDAVRFLDRLYRDNGFGYLERSTEQLADLRHAEAAAEETLRFLPTRPGLAKFIKSTGKFKKQDLEEVLDIDRDEANAVISHLIKARMIRRAGGLNVATPSLQAVLRGYKGE